MVVCNVEIPRPPPPPPPLFNWGPQSLVPLVPLIPPKLESSSTRSKRSTTSQSFRLNDKDETGSIYSVYKQKIDSMFESDSSSTKNSVQARIEKMFTDVAKDGDVEVKDNGSHSFSVDYMGSVPLLHKVGSLSGLQDPLKELYFAYKRNFKDVASLTGRLEISSIGLKIQYRGETGDLEQLNSFPTIAVWSAVKFVLHDETGKTSYAFLPLITDPDNIDKQTLFKTLNTGDKIHVNSESHSPLFAVVMRKTGLQKQLECHGFICQTSEDAIVIAATLYKSLMAHMKSKDKKPKNKNGVTCMSVASSIAYEGSNSLIPIRPPRKKRSSSSSAGSDKDPLEGTEVIPLIPNHSQLLKKSVKAKKAPSVPPKKLDLDAILKCDETTTEPPKIEEPKEIKPAALTNQWNTLMSNQQKKITAEIKQVISEGSHRGLQKPSTYVATTDENFLDRVMPEISGDILTKVTIPRSGSFLNAGGLTRYKSKVTRENGQQAGGSPLGFNELFNEFRLQEGLHSVDEILGVIIDPEGMSFNDLKPIYKEFLLKLAVTLTKDELYQRSKAIMRRQRKKLIRRTSNLHSNKGNIIVNKKFKSLKHIFQKSLKMKLGKKIVKPQRQKLDITRKPSSKIADSSISTSSYDTRQFRPKTQLSQSSRKQNYRRRSGEFKTLSVRERMSTSEESDFFSVRRGKTRGQYQVNGNQNRNSSSGYVSCSECSYDSDTCTCVSADKCYCSLGQKINKKHKGKCKSFPKRPLAASKCYCNCQEAYSYCGCDTDSCADSNKCYCPNGETTTILDQLKRRGFIPSIELVNDSIRHRKLCKSNSNTKSTKSLEYMHNPSEEYYERVRLKELQAKRNSYNTRARRSYSSDNLAVDYELFSVAKRHLQSRPSFGTPYLTKQASVRSYNSSRHGGRHQGKTLRSTSVSAGACTEALSVKKSAEIAALFADIKLSQTTDITHLIPPDYENDKKIIKQNKTKLDKNCSKIDQKYSIPNKNLINLSKSVGKNSMYSARNGLYTIQSQSDDSRRSSVCEPSRQKRKDFFNFESQFDEKCVSTNIEDSLGYLP